jgi:putative endonuclease
MTLRHQNTGQHAREKDRGSVNSSAIRATDDVLSCRSARSGGRGFVFQQPHRQQSDNFRRPDPLGPVARGRSGEEAAAIYLSSKGYILAARNQRTPAGELDLVCTRDGLLVVVEVKARSSCEYGAALEAIGPRKAHRLRASAVWWLAEHGLPPCQVRFDAVTVVLDREGQPVRLRHFKDIIGQGW